MRAEEYAADLMNRGYVEVQNFGSLAVGARVRQSAERYDRAVIHGTGNIERIFHKPNSAWSQTWGSADVELIVKRDEPRFSPDDTHAFLASYHVIPMDVNL